MKKQQIDNKLNIDEVQANESRSPPLIRPGKLKLSNMIVMSGSNQITPSLNIKNSRLVRSDE